MKLPLRQAVSATDLKTRVDQAQPLRKLYNALMGSCRCAVADVGQALKAKTAEGSEKQTDATKKAAQAEAAKKRQGCRQAGLSRKSRENDAMQVPVALAMESDRIADGTRDIIAASIHLEWHMTKPFVLTSASSIDAAMQEDESLAHFLSDLEKVFGGAHDGSYRRSGPEARARRCARLHRLSSLRCCCGSIAIERYVG